MTDYHSTFLVKFDTESAFATVMTTTPTRKSRTGLVVGIVVILIILLIAVAPIIPVSKSIAMPYATSQEESTTIFQISSETIPAGQYVDQSAALTVGEDVAVTWSADNTVDAYIFSSTQFASYQSSGITSNFMASQTSSSGGTISFHVSASDTYYLVIHNGHNGFFGIGSQPVGLFSASGTATYEQVVTQTSYTTTPCNVNLISYASGGNC